MSVAATDRSDVFQFNGLTFRIVRDNYDKYQTNSDEIVILKPPSFLDLYRRVFQSAPTKNVIEVGFFEGGSIIYLALAFPDMKFVGVDLRPENPNVTAYLRKIGIEDRVKLYYRTDQTNDISLQKIIDDEFGLSGVGLIIDDASHHYEPSKKTFESLFPHLSTGGLYCLEDWAWAHWPEPYQSIKWADRPALSNLAFEFLITMASAPNLIDHIEAFPQMVVARRGSAQVGVLNIDKVMRTRAKQITLI